MGAIAFPLEQGKACCWRGGSQAIENRRREIGQGNAILTTTRSPPNSDEEKIKISRFSFFGEHGWQTIYASFSMNLFDVGRDSAPRRNLRTPPDLSPKRPFVAEDVVPIEIGSDSGSAQKFQFAKPLHLISLNTRWERWIDGIQRQERL
jgi:hypothetical protein